MKLSTCTFLNFVKTKQGLLRFTSVLSKSQKPVEKP